MLVLLVLYLIQAISTPLSAGKTIFDHNLAYDSPFHNHPQFSLDSNAVHSRAFTKRQNVDASTFHDEHYATFYGGDFSNAPSVWGGGINFTHSVASGDPYDTSVLLWTRAVPSSVQDNFSPDGPDQSVPVCVQYKVYSTPSMDGNPVTQGEAFTSYDVDWTVKVEATGLKADTRYWYQFNDCTHSGAKSPIGATRTIASPNTDAEKVNNGKPMTFAVFSCSRFFDGWFNAYGVAATNTSADIFVHLGDYIYESLGNGAAIGRETFGRELATIADYRLRMAQYRGDPGLRLAHETAPWIADDHEVADNAWKAGTADSNDTASGCKFANGIGACFTDRKLAAVRAYHEWMPIRQIQADDKLRIWRNFQIGRLLDLTMLDTRQYDRDITDVYYNTEYVNSIAAYTNRSVMGLSQEKWFLDTLTASKDRDATWRLIGQQIVFTQLNESGSFDLDAWDGYRANRQRILSHIYRNKIDNVVVLSGDSHANWVSDVSFYNDSSYDPDSGEGALGVEFAGTAVTSTSSFGAGISPQDANIISTRLLSAEGNEELQWSEGSYRGFYTLMVTPEYVNATYFAMSDVTSYNLNGFESARFSITKGENRLQRPIAGGTVQAGVLKSDVPGALQRYPLSSLLATRPAFRFETGFVDKASFAYLAIGITVCVLCGVHGLQEARRFWSYRKKQFKI